MAIPAQYVAQKSLLVNCFARNVECVFIATKVIKVSQKPIWEVDMFSTWNEIMKMQRMLYTMAIVPSMKNYIGMATGGILMVTIMPGVSIYTTAYYRKN